MARLRNRMIVNNYGPISPGSSPEPVEWEITVKPTGPTFVVLAHVGEDVHDERIPADSTVSVRWRATWATRPQAREWSPAQDQPTTAGA